MYTWLLAAGAQDGGHDITGVPFVEEKTGACFSVGGVSTRTAH
ncbi:hypothetical protein [Mycobacterium camsae]|nr:hypothetical protein [Mycobacterium gordonae]